MYKLFYKLFLRKLETACPFIPKHFSVYFLKTKTPSFITREVIKTRKCNINTVILSNALSIVKFYQLLQQWHLQLFFPPVQAPIQDHALPSVVVSTRSPLIWNSLSLCFLTLTFLKSTASYQISLSWDLSDVSS